MNFKMPVQFTQLQRKSSRIAMQVLLALIGFSMIQGCISVRSNHGYVLARGTEELDAKAGVDTKESVLARYGEPSMLSTFSSKRWYYLNSTNQTRAFLKPKTNDRKIVAFHFDDEGVVTKVEDYDLEDGDKVKLVSRVTRTKGKELSFWEQLLGSVGTLPLPGADGAGGPGRP